MKIKTVLLLFVILIGFIKTEAQSLKIDSLYIKNATDCKVCNGSAYSIVSYGTSPYTYHWSNGATTSRIDSNLCPGTYYLRVVDSKGDTALKYFTIGSTFTPVIYCANAGCNNNNGYASSNASGGVSPYTYSWSNGGTTHSITGLSAGKYVVTITDANGCHVKDSVNVLRGLNISISATNDSCYGKNDGKATATASGGTSPYTYSWKPSGGTNQTATGLSAGTYTVTITDNTGCTGKDSITISQPASLVPVIYHANAGCNSNNGYASAHATGGASPYTYSWSNGATSAATTGLSAGKYYVTITDAHGCSVKDSVSILGELTVSVSTTNDSCYGKNDGSAIATASGGTSPYTYSWKPSGGTNQTATGLSAGYYTVTITDKNGCTGKDSITITQPAALKPVIYCANAGCNSNNGYASSNASGGVSPYTYLWSNGGTTHSITGLSAGKYVVTITDAHGCSVKDSITVLRGLNVSISAINDSCYGKNDGKATASASGGTSPYTYSWKPSGGTNQTATGLSAGTYTVTITDNTGCTGKDSITISQPASLTPVIYHANAGCNSNNGYASAHATGGASPYTYSWSNGATSAATTGLSAGKYYVTITDAHGCSVKDSVSILGELTVSVSTTNDSCYGKNDGSAIATASGGTSPYTYSWKPSGGTNQTATGLSAGYYTVTITDKNGCTGKDSITITQPAALKPVIYCANAGCNSNNGYASSNASGGVSPYTYLWSNGGTTHSITGLSAGKYVVTITDAHGCSVKDSITVLRGLNVSISASNDSCYGKNDGKATASASGGTSPYTYSWKPSGGTNQTATGLSAGTYTVTITDNTGCTGKDSVAITEPKPMTLVVKDTVVPDSILCDGVALVYVSGGNKPYTFTWSPHVFAYSDTLLPYAEAADSLCNGEYHVCVTDAHGCSVCDSFYIGHRVLGIAIVEDNGDKLKIYPIPASNELFVQPENIPDASYQLSVYDLMGREILNQKNIQLNQGAIIPVDISKIPSGTYMLRVYTTGYSKTAPFIVTH